MNARHNALGSGNRANATIGRAVRLTAMNVLGAKTGGMDGSSLGHPGKYSFCFAEDDPPDSWVPLRVDLGYPEDDTTVTVIAAEAPRQVANAQNPDGWGVLRTFAAAMRAPSTYSVGKGHQVLLVFGPEHTQAVVDAGISKDEARDFLVTESRVTQEWLTDAGVIVEEGYQHDMSPAADGKLPVVPEAEDLIITTAGGAGAGWSALHPCLGSQAALAVCHASRQARRRKPYRCVGPEVVRSCGTEEESMTAITVLRPDEQARPTEYIGYANRQEVPEGAHLILIENGKPRARDMLADELEARYPIGSVEVFSKPSASKPIEADEAKEMAARAHMVITGVGD